MNSLPIGGERQSRSLARHFTEEVAILAATPAQNAIGEVTLSYAVRPGLDRVRAAIGPVDVGLRVRPQETRKDEVTQIRHSRRYMLQGHYPEIKHSDRMRWDGADWNIVAILHDSSRTYTAGLIEQVVPGDV